MSNVKSFRPFKAPAGIPILGGPTPPAQIRDAIGRVLQTGDLIHLQVTAVQPYRVTSITPCIDPSVPPGMLEISLVSSVRFRAGRDLTNVEFLRIMSREEADQMAGRIPVDPPTAAIVEGNDGTISESEVGEAAEAVSGDAGSDGAAADLGAVQPAPEVAHLSARSCGCDPDVPWICERHRAEAADHA